ncbi:acyltransferase [bacterium]|nr:acyltransferase [bacterium]
MKKFFIKSNIKGSNNKIEAFYDGKWHQLRIKNANSNFWIKGNNNVIKFHLDTKTLPKNFNLTINGSNNYIEIIGPIKFNNTTIEIEGNENIFKIKKPARVVKNCYFCLEGLAEVNIDEDCGLNMGLYAIINNNFKNKHKLTIGKGVFIGKDVIIRTSDGHAIIDPETGLAINEPQDIEIGDNVWIGARNMILKGTKIPSGSIVGAQSVVNKKFETTNVLIAGNPAKIIRNNVFWDVRDFGRYMKETTKE